MSDIYEWLVNAIGSLGSTGRTTDFASFSDLMQTMQKSGFNGNITDSTETKAALWFYNHWGNYLQAQPGVLSFLWTVLGWGVIALYDITAALENVFNNLFKLFGLFGYLNDPSTLIGKFYQGFQILGIAIFSFLAIVQIVIGIFGKPFKYKDAILHLLIVTFAVAVLPTAIVKVSSVLYTDITNKQNGIENITGKKDKKDDAKDTLAIQPVKYNTTDIMELIKGDFNTKRFPLDKYGNLKGNGAYNSITDNPKKIDSGNFITHINFGASLGATDTETLENLEKKDNMKGIKGLFLHYPSDTGVAIKSVNEHRLISGANLAEKVYSRYKVNFLAIYAQYVVLIILLGLMSVKLVTSIFELLLTGLVAPIQGYSSVTSHSKFKELLLTISGTIAGIYFEVIIMRIVLEIMRAFPTIAMTVYDTNGNIVGKSATFFSGLGPFESSLASIIVYIGLFFSAMRGVTIVERWLGVSVGQNDMAQQVMGAMIATNALTQTTKAAGNVVAGVAGVGYSMAKATPDVAKNVSGGLSKAAGVASGVGDQIAQQGLGGTVKGGLFNADDAISNKIQNGVDGLKDKYQEGHNGASEALRNNYPTPEDKLNHLNTYDDSVASDSEPNNVPIDTPIEGEEYDDHDNISPTTNNGEMAPVDDGLVAGDISEEEQIDRIPNVDGGITEEVADKTQGLSENDLPENVQTVDGGLRQNQLDPNADNSGISQENNDVSSEGNKAQEAILSGGLRNESVKEVSQPENKVYGSGVSETNDTTSETSANIPVQIQKENGGVADNTGERSVGQTNFLNATPNETNVSRSTAGPTIDQTVIPEVGSTSIPTASSANTQSAQTGNLTEERAQNVQNTDNKPTHFQKASTQYQQANQSLSQGMQYMTSGRSHIHGKRDDDDE